MHDDSCPVSRLLIIGGALRRAGNVYGEQDLIKGATAQVISLIDRWSDGTLPAGGSREWVRRFNRWTATTQRDHAGRLILELRHPTDAAMRRARHLLLSDRFAVDNRIVVICCCPG